MTFRETKRGPTLDYISPEELHDRITDPEAKRRTFILDVRDQDAHCGQIVGSTNIPMTHLMESCLPFVADGIAKTCDVAVVHCMMSQVRGPRAANRLYQYLQQKHPQCSVQVRILTGGFARFGMMYHEDKTVVKHFVPDDFEADVGLNSIV